MSEVTLESHGGYHVGDTVYFNHPTESWIRGKVTSIKRVAKKDGFTQVCFGCTAILNARYLPALCIEESSAQVYPLREHDIHHIIASCTEPHAQTTLNDLLELSYLHDATLLEQVRVRYFENLIYTHIGPIMLALNPYDYTLPNYTVDKMPNYIREGSAALESQSRNIPHAWTTAHRSYWLLRTEGRNQSIIVSGESGAGKTETAKIVLKYIGVVSTAQCSPQEKANAEEITQKVNLTSPILEGFGNAKTKKNDNSSRFGKFMKVFFAPSSSGGVMTGATIRVYLLEKSRIVTHGKGERGYHSLYQLLARSSDSKAVRSAEKQQLLHRLQLQRAEDYNCTAVGGATVIEGVDDAADFDEVMQAMEFVGMTPAERTTVWEVAASVLHLLALPFRAVSEDECVIDKAAPGAELHVRMVRELLGLSDDSFFRELTTTTQVMRGETIVRKLRHEQAVDLRDGVAKALYEALFLWLVEKINDLLAPQSASSTGIPSSAECSWIGLLDIFGFENFSHGNSFEQLCINLANETLQNHYNSIIFTRDIEECRSEGINTESVVFYDNQPCLDLICGMNFTNCGPNGAPKITNRTSLLHFLDEESALAKGSDLTFCEKVNSAYGGRLLDGKGGHPNFQTVKTDRGSFLVRHYAGDVTYRVDGFRSKNSDPTKETLKDAIRASTVPLIASLLGPASSERSSAVKSSVGVFFRGQLAQLMGEINATHPHWIRCIKPHSAKRLRMFNGGEVMAQMRSAGVLETVKIRQNSFSVRLPFADFIRSHWLMLAPLPALVRATAPKEYLSLLSAPLPPPTATPRELASIILQRGGVDDAKCAQVGNTRVFLRTEASQQLACILRGLQKGCAFIVQAAARQLLSRRRVCILQLRRHLYIIAAAVQSLGAQRCMRELELHRRKALLLHSMRHLLILQTNEEKDRASLVTNEKTHRELCVDDWMDALREAQAAVMASLVSSESAARACVARGELDSRALLHTVADELDARGELEVEEATMRMSSCRLAASVLHKAVSHWRASRLVESEGNARCLLTRVACVSLDELRARVCVGALAADALDALRLSERAALADAWRRAAARRSLLSRRALLLLQREECAARQEIFTARALRLAETVSSAQKDAAEAAARLAARLCAEAAERRRLQIALGERRALAVRRAAQSLWRAAAEEERRLSAVRSARAALAAATRDWAMHCRRMETTRRGARADAEAMRALSLCQQRREAAAAALAEEERRVRETAARLDMSPHSGMEKESRNEASIRTRRVLTPLRETPSVHNPFSEAWSPGEPDADGSYWVFLPGGEQVALVPATVTAEHMDPDAVHVVDSEERRFRDSPEPYVPCFTR